MAIPKGKVLRLTAICLGIRTQLDLHASNSQHHGARKQGASTHSWLLPFQNVSNFHKKKSFKFSIAERVGEFCVKVKPAISSSTNPGLWSEECVKITKHCTWGGNCFWGEEESPYQATCHISPKMTSVLLHSPM